MGGPAPAGVGLSPPAAAPGAPWADRRGGECWPGRVRYRVGVTVWETVLVFAALPLAGLGVLALLTFAPGASRTPRYRVGRPWDHEPVWYVARPDVPAPAGSAAGRAAIASAGSGFRELPGGAPAPDHGSLLDTRTGTARGGASGEW